ncbi:MAG TPA: hypothetical protein VHD87_15380 [Acidimicrobiales bacterium]|nr:hypothetical protein [Acidimicrobiales bacterium]
MSRRRQVTVERPAALPPIPDLNRVFGERVAPPEPAYLPEPPKPKSELGARLLRAVLLLIVAVFSAADVVLAIRAGGTLRTAGLVLVGVALFSSAVWRLSRLPKPFVAPTEVPRRRWLR